MMCPNLGGGGREREGEGSREGEREREKRRERRRKNGEQNGVQRCCGSARGSWGATKREELSGIG